MARLVTFGMGETIDDLAVDASARVLGAGAQPGGRGHAARVVPPDLPDLRQADTRVPPVIRTTAEAIQELGVVAVVCRAVTLGLLAGAVFDDPIDRGVIACAIFFLVLGEAALWLHRHYVRKYGR
jgi:hypothetical protein